MKIACPKLAGVGLLAAMAVAVAAQSGLIGFGVKDREVKERLAEAVLNGNLPVYPNAKLYHAATPVARVAFVKAFLATAKACTVSAAFKTDYAERRQQAKPDDPQAKGSAEQQMSQQLAEQRKNLEETKAQVAKMTPEMQKQMKDMLKQMEDQLKQQTSDPSMQAGVKQIYEEQARQEQVRYKKSMAEWAANYPEQPGAVIAKRLHEFLALTADIDFDAKLVVAPGGKMNFANPQYESKNSEWKLCYRAGREPIAAARAFATDWLHQLGQ